MDREFRREYAAKTVFGAFMPAGNGVWASLVAR